MVEATWLKKFFAPLSQGNASRPCSAGGLASVSIAAYGEHMPPASLLNGSHLHRSPLAAR